jgi:hypothetical protein
LLGLSFSSILVGKLVVAARLSVCNTTLAGRSLVVRRKKLNARLVACSLRSAIALDIFVRFATTTDGFDRQPSSILAMPIAARELKLKIESRWMSCGCAL